MSACIFCNILEGTIPTTKIHEDDRCLAFEDVNPQAPVHALIIPKRHVESLEEFHEEDTDLLGHLLHTCRAVANLKGLSNAGYRVVANTGSQAGQTVFHFHLHVLGGRNFRWPPG